MPRTHISMLKGRSAQFHEALFDHVYEAMRETFNVPPDDRFMTLTEHEPAHFRYGKNYLGIERTDSLILIEIVCNDTRSGDQKKALFQRIAQRLSDHLEVRPEDVFVGLVEVDKGNWSFGRGEAQYG